MTHVSAVLKMSQPMIHTPVNTATLDPDLLHDLRGGGQQIHGHVAKHTWHAPRRAQSQNLMRDQIIHAFIRYTGVFLHTEKRGVTTKAPIQASVLFTFTRALAPMRSHLALIHLRDVEVVIKHPLWTLLSVVLRGTRVCGVSY